MKHFRAWLHVVEPGVLFWIGAVPFFIGFLLGWSEVALGWFGLSYPVWFKIPAAIVIIVFMVFFGVLSFGAWLGDRLDRRSTGGWMLIWLGLSAAALVAPVLFKRLDWPMGEVAYYGAFGAAAIWMFIGVWLFDATDATVEGAEVEEPSGPVDDGEVSTSGRTRAVDLAIAASVLWAIDSAIRRRRGRHRAEDRVRARS